MRVLNDGVGVMRSTGDGFWPERVWAGSPPPNRMQTEVVDVTGDGRSDLVFVPPNGVIVRPSTGTDFGGGSNWTGCRTTAK